MNSARFLRLLSMIAGLVAVALGLGTYTHANFTDIHMLFGLLVALTLLVLAALAIFTGDLWRIGAAGAVYALLVPVFGVTQQMILTGEAHWLIEFAHLLVGFGAVALSGIISARLVQRKQAAGREAAAAKVSQAAS